MTYTSRAASLERTTPSTSLIDVLDRVLDKGIVIDLRLRVSLVGVELIAVDGQLIVASIHTYRQYADGAGLAPFRRERSPGVTKAHETLKILEDLERLIGAGEDHVPSAVTA